MKAMYQHLIIIPTFDTGGEFYMVQMEDSQPKATAKFEAYLTFFKSMENLKLLIIDPLWPFIGGDITKDPVWSMLSCGMIMMGPRPGSDTAR